MAAGPLPCGCSWKRKPLNNDNAHRKYMLGYSWAIVGTDGNLVSSNGQRVHKNDHGNF